ncbi:MAG: rhodanese-like domain-containing protein [Bacteroidota bacterium]
MYRQKSSGSSPLFLKRKLEEGAVLLDVRTHHEHAGYHWEGAVNIPCEEIECMKSFIKDWNKPVVVFSAQGRRSEIATRKLQRAGVEAYNGGAMWDLESFFGCN